MVDTLYIYTLKEDGSIVSFPPKDATPSLPYSEQAAIGSYTFTSGRMGSTNVQATLMYPICLDKYWTGLEFIEFRGERYWIFSTPTSSKDNNDIRYKHELNFTSERISLDNTYFFDVVSPDATDVDQFVSNSTKFTFFGDISEFVKRMNYSLQYSGLGYSIVLDEGVSSEGKLMSFEDKFFSDVLVEVFNVYELPYYFVGKTIHIGFTSNAITHPFRYGYDKELLYISKTNANYRVINRCTGVGSSENIPYYYPNDNAKGLIKAEAGATNTGIQTSDIVVENMDLYSEKIQVEGKVEYVENKDVFVYPMIYLDYEKQYPYTERVKLTSFRPHKVGDITFPFPTQMELFEVSLSSTYFYVLLDLANDSDVNINSNYAFTHYVRYRKPGYVNTLSDYFIIFPMAGVTLNEKVALLNKETNTFEDVSGWTVPLKAGTNFLRFYIDPEYTFATNTSTLSNFDRWNDAYSMVDFSFKCEFSRNIWYYNERSIRLSDIGLSLKKEANVGDYIIQKQTTGSLTIFSDRLMPPIYRETNGEERFYPAKNDTYLSPETGEYYQFENEYQGNNPKEMIVTFDYIKPTIKNVKNAEGFPIGEILDVAFDDQDNDEFDDKENKWEHPYFYIKLRRFNGDYGFNLFDQGIANGEMTISMTSGNCSACNFKIGVSEDENVPNKFYNTVQIDDNGNLVEGDWNKKINNKNIIPAQQNTMTNEVWIAVEKDTDTFGTIMPSNIRNYKPKTGDSFVLINIDLPKAYILAAENELKEAIIKYMAANNSEKFNFSINFKRIFFAEYPEILAQLDENARLLVEYDGNQYTLYVSNYTYKVTNDQILPEIVVELSDTITVKKGTLQKSIDAVKADIMTSIGSIDFLKMGLKYFIRKDVDDSANGHIVFKDGAFFTRGAGEDVSDAIILQEEGNSIHEENNAIQEDTPSPLIDVPADTTLGELANVKAIVDEPSSEDVILIKKKGSTEWTQEKKSLSAPDKVYVTTLNLAYLENEHPEVTQEDKDEVLNIIQKFKEGYVVTYTQNTVSYYDSTTRYTPISVSLSEDETSVYISYNSFEGARCSLTVNPILEVGSIWEVSYEISPPPFNGKTYGMNNGEWVEIQQGGGGSIVVDDHLDLNSINPVQNKIVAMNINELMNEVFKLLFMTINGGGMYEKGRTITPSISWRIARKGEEVNPTFASVNGSTNNISADKKSWTSPSSITTNNNYNIVCGYETQEVSKTISYSFSLKKYWGTSSSKNLTNSDILSLSSGWATRTMGKTKFDCTGGKYIYYIIPSSIYGNGVEFWVNGFVSTDTIVDDVIVTNSYNVSEPYKIIRLTNIQTGILEVEFK